MLERLEPHVTERYTRTPDTRFVHWGMMAGSLRYLTTRSARYLDFASFLATAFLTKLRPASNPESNACGAVEGLAAAAFAMVAGERKNDPLFRRALDRIEAELQKSLTMQILPGQTEIRFGEHRLLSDPTIARVAGAFLNGRYLAAARIDAAQHCLSALMHYDALVAAVGHNRSL
jgi:hypothetical protein